MPTSSTSDERPLRIAYLAYRGKPHVGGQGVYTRHLTKALVDLGHTVEVYGGNPYPILDERVPLHELPSLDIYNEHFPMRMPGIWELKHWTDFVEVSSFSAGGRNPGANGRPSDGSGAGTLSKRAVNPKRNEMFL